MNQWMLVVLVTAGISLVMGGCIYMVVRLCNVCTACVSCVQDMSGKLVTTCAEFGTRQREAMDRILAASQLDAYHSVKANEATAEERLRRRHELNPLEHRGSVV